MTTDPPGIPFPLQLSDIGGELLDILSRGLYSDARDALREYVQNGVDAKAKRITITVRSGNVVVYDNGIGMDLAGLKRARRFGMSGKSPKQNIGFRGIGIYSSFGMCDQLTVTTRTATADYANSMVMDFAAMRAVLDADREAAERTSVNLATLFQEHVYLDERTDRGKAGQSFTEIRLDTIAEEFLPQLTNLEELSRYFNRSLPVKYPDVAYGTDVNRIIKDNLNLKLVPLYLRIGTEDEILVIPKVATDTDPVVRFHDITNASDEKIALIWYSLTEKGIRLKAPSGTPAGEWVDGFTQKIQGFTLGDGLKLKPLWPSVGSRSLYHHFTGEIHYREKADVYPNAARDDLEATGNKRIVQQAVRDFFTRLNAVADLNRTVTSTSKLVEQWSSDLTIADRNVGTDSGDNAEIFSQMKNLGVKIQARIKSLEDLRSQKSLDEVQDYDELKEAADELAFEIVKIHERVVGVQDIAHELTQKKTKSAPSKPAQRQTSLIESTLDELQSQTEKQPSNQELNSALAQVAKASELHMLGAALDALEELMGKGIDLGEKLDELRRQMRATLGLSESEFSSLADALEAHGLFLSTEREISIVGMIDAGIQSATGGKNKSYASIVDAIADEVLLNAPD